MTDALADNLLAYLSSPAPDVWIIAIHPGGNAAGKKVVEAIAKAGFPVIAAEEIKNDRDKFELIAVLELIKNGKIQCIQKKNDIFIKERRMNG